MPAIKAATGAPVLAEGPHRAARPLHVGEAPRLDAANDTDFRPDRALADGEVVSGDGWTHRGGGDAGPHRQPHGLSRFKEANVLFSGDHVMAWSTPVVAPPDGAMSDYMASLEKLAQRSEPIYFPGHGGGGAQCAALRRRLYPAPQGARGRRSCTGWPRARADIPTLVRAIYVGLDPRLTKAAGMSVLAHLEDLVARGAVATDGPPSIAGRYRLARLSAFAGAGLAGFGRLRRRLRRSRAADRVVDVLEQAADARGIGAEIVAAVARGRAHVDARAVAVGADAHRHVVAEAHDRRARHRLDLAVARGRPAAARSTTTRHLRLVMTASAAS